jgi:hypothetical protein
MTGGTIAAGVSSCATAFICRERILTGGRAS